MSNFEVDNYKSIKNYIHNYLGLTKDEVRSIVEEVVKQSIKEEVEKYFKDENRLVHLVEKEITRQIKYDGKYDRRYFIQNTMDAIYNRIDSVIHEEVLKRLQITLKEPEDK